MAGVVKMWISAAGGDADTPAEGRIFYITNTTGFLRGCQRFGEGLSGGARVKKPDTERFSPPSGPETKYPRFFADLRGFLEC